MVIDNSSHWERERKITSDLVKNRGGGHIIIIYSICDNDDILFVKRVLDLKVAF